MQTKNVARAVMWSGCTTKICPEVPPPFPYKLGSKILSMSSETTPQPRRRKSRSDLVHLRSLPSTQPATKIGQVNWAWTEIEAALAVGVKLKEIWEAAGRDGLEMSYAQFRVYISRLRRRRQQFKAPETLSPPAVATNHEDGLQAPPSDPFRNLREQREKKKQSVFEYDPFSINKNLT
jgi:hypothetical protein